MPSQIRGTQNWAAKTGSENSICAMRGAALHCANESQKQALKTQREATIKKKGATRSNFRWLDAGPILGPASVMAQVGGKQQPRRHGRRMAWLSSPERLGAGMRRCSRNNPSFERRRTTIKMGRRKPNLESTDLLIR